MLTYTELYLYLHLNHSFEDLCDHLYVSHVLVSFQDVRTLETKGHADRLTNEYIGLIQKYEETDGHEEE